MWIRHFLAVAVGLSVIATPTFAASRTRFCTTSPGSDVLGSALLTTDVDTGVITGNVVTPDRAVSFVMSRGVLTTGDGYSVRSRVVSNTKKDLVVEITAANPAGAQATALIALNKSNGETTKANGAVPFGNVLGSSQDFPVLARVLPNLVSNAASDSSAHPGMHGTARVENVVDCSVAEVEFATASAAVVYYCFIAEAPFECFAALSAMGTTAVKMSQACSPEDFAYHGPPMDEPVCTSLTIC